MRKFGGFVAVGYPRSMGNFRGGLKGLVAQSKRAAQRRGQKPTTAHTLLVMLQHDPETSTLLAKHGVLEGELLVAIRADATEPDSALEHAVELAGKLAEQTGETASPLHLLLALIRDPRSAAVKCLERVGALSVADDARASLGQPRRPSRVKGPSADREQSLEDQSARRPRSTGARDPIPPRGRGRRSVPPGTNADSTTTRIGSASEAMRALLSDVDPLPSDAAHTKSLQNGKASPEVPQKPPSARANVRTDRKETGKPYSLDLTVYPVLGTLGRNLTEAAHDGKLDPVIARDDEIEQTLDILARRRANNPILVGPPGVGKTAIVEGVAQRLASEEGDSETPTIVVEISSGALVSGTSVRGALAERMRRVREEVQQSEGRILLFIDEVHAVIGGGDGPDDLAQELKSSLARGELPCIGATTEAEYRKHIEKDAALARRFSPVRVGEPSAAAAREILAGIAPKYERHHAVQYESEALDFAIKWSVRFLSERCLPDKAIGIVDLAAARVKRRGGNNVDRQAIASVVSELADVPVERIMEQDVERLLKMEQRLAEKVVGHARPIATIADVLRKGAAGFRGKRPLGTFLLLGPTGVGKTEMAKAVAELVFSNGAMTRLDMSEYSEAHAVARLMGAPPGYVGHDDGGQLTEAVRNRPYQLILLDEIEKAHPDVLLALLPLLDEGRMTDSKGRLVDFTNTILFMTSNLGADVPTETARIGFGASSHAECKTDQRDRALAAARGAMPPELWNRIDDPLYFAPLERDEVSEIARRRLSALADTVFGERGVVIEVERSAIEALIDAGGYDVALGARPMKRTIGRLVEAPLASMILRGELSEGDTVILEGAGSEVLMSVAAVAAE